MAEFTSEVRDGMRIDWDVPITVDDGFVLRAERVVNIKPLLGRVPWGGRRAPQSVRERYAVRQLSRLADRVDLAAEGYAPEALAPQLREIPGVRVLR
jgi:hypothetical protein